jgi:CheY-like chemotaxis protein
MGGETGFESEPGKGATFWLTIRLAKGGEDSKLTTSPPGVSAEAIIRSRFAGCRILLAEDEPINREVTLTLLNDVDLVTDLAEDGQVAVEQTSKNDYALILMDMQMPNLDGLEATRQIRRMPGKNTVPIIAMTANAFTEDKLRCIEAGMNDFISKPVHPELFFTTLLNWLSREKH